MNEEDTYQALREILPELQHKLRQSIEEEFRVQLQKAQQFYKKYADDMIAKRQKQLKN